MTRVSVLALGCSDHSMYACFYPCRTAVERYHHGRANQVSSRYTRVKGVGKERLTSGLLI